MNNDFLAQSGVSLSRLANLAKVIEAGGVSAASGGDPSTQSLYSRQMGELEDALGKRLFTRDGRGRKPTIVAKQLATVYAAFSQSVGELIGDSQGRESVLRIGAGDSVYRWILLPALQRVQDRFPGIAFEFKNLRTQSVIDQIQSGAVDIGIAEMRTMPSGINARDLRNLEFGLYYHLDTFGECDVGECLSRKKLIGLGGSGSYVRNCHNQQGREGLEERFWLTFDSLPMIANSMVQADASAFLPIEMEEDLREKGFECIKGPEMSDFSRKYSLLIDKYSSRIRRTVLDVSDALVDVLG